MILVKETNGSHDFLCRPIALHLHGIKIELHAGIPAAGHGNHIMHRRPRRRRDDAHALREKRQWPLPLHGKKPFSGELGFQFLIGLQQRPCPLRRHAAHIELIHAVPLVHRNLAAGDHLISIHRLETQIPRPPGKHDALQRRLAVFQSEIAMPRRIPFEIGNLPGHLHTTQHRHMVKHIFDQPIDVADRIHWFHSLSSSPFCLNIFSSL